VNPLNPLQQDAIFSSRAHRRQWLAAVMGQDDCPSAPAQTAENRGVDVLARSGLSQRVATMAAAVRRSGDMRLCVMRVVTRHGGTTIDTTKPTN
jgi:hypothetical protein